MRRSGERKGWPDQLMARARMPRFMVAWVATANGRGPNGATLIQASSAMPRVQFILPLHSPRRYWTARGLANGPVRYSRGASYRREPIHPSHVLFPRRRASSLTLRATDHEYYYVQVQYARKPMRFGRQALFRSTCDNSFASNAVWSTPYSCQCLTGALPHPFLPQLSSALRAHVKV